MDRLDVLYIKSIEIIKENQSGFGLFIASPEFENYKYCWQCDGTFIAYSMNLCRNNSFLRKYYCGINNILKVRSKKIKQLIDTYNKNGFIDKKNVLPTRFSLEGKITETEWPEFQIDGWRIDIPWKVPRDFWQIFKKKVKKINPDAYIIGEIWRDASPWIEGDTFDGVMNYRLRDLVIDFFIKDSIDAEDFDYELLYLRELHDLNAYKMLNLLSSHDVPRILTVANNNIKRLKISVVFLMTYIGAPMIYYGDEIGMVGENDPDCRRTMIWDKSLWNKEINNIYRKLIRFRMEHESLRSGSFKTLLVFNRLYVYQRLKGSDAVIVVLNAGEKQDKVTVPLKNSAIFYESWVDLFTKNKYKVVGNCLEIKNVSKLSALLLKPDKTESKNCVA